MGRKKHSKELKARIALDAIKGQKTISELSSEDGIHANKDPRGKPFCWTQNFLVPRKRGILLSYWFINAASGRVLYPSFAIKLNI